MSHLKLKICCLTFQPRGFFLFFDPKNRLFFPPGLWGEKMINDELTTDEIIDSKGYLHIISGCMWAGKTTKLRNLLYDFTLKGYKSIFFSHDETDRNRETRSDNPFGKSIPAITYIKELNKNTLIESDIKVIAIDECQFFNERIIEFVIKYLELQKIILLSGLNGTYEAKTFGFMHFLFPHAFKIEILHAKCNLCNKPASYTARISDSTELVEIGDDKYMALCADCFNHCKD